MSPRGDTTVGDLATIVREAGVRLDGARVTSTGIVARVQLARCLASVMGARSARQLRALSSVEVYVLGVLVDIEAADAVAELAPDEACPCCDGNGWLETAEGHQIACELCDERGLVARDATYHACEESYESIDAAIEASCEVAS